MDISIILFIITIAIIFLLFNLALDNMNDPFKRGDMTVKFLPDNFIVWRVKLGKREMPKSGYDLFVLAPDLVAAHEAAMNHEREMTRDDNLVLSIEIVADCILDGS